jgi:hypothetical protein
VLEDRYLPSGLGELPALLPTSIDDPTQTLLIAPDGDTDKSDRSTKAAWKRAHKLEKQATDKLADDGALPVLDRHSVADHETKELSDHGKRRRDPEKARLHRHPKGKTAPPGTGGVGILSSTPVITIQATDANAAELGLKIGEFTVTRSMADNDFTANLTIYYTVSGTASPNGDYWSFTGSLTFIVGLTEGEGVSTQKLIVRPLDDYHANESPETVVLTLSADASYTVGAQDTATVTITSNDTPPAAYEMIIPYSNLNPITVEEGAGSSSYYVTLSSPPSSSVTINLTTLDSQVSLQTTQLNFTPFDWMIPKTVIFSAVDDTVNEVSPHPGMIRHTASSADSRYNGDVKDLQVTVRDNEVIVPWEPSQTERFCLPPPAEQC